MFYLFFSLSFLLLMPFILKKNKNINKILKILVIPSNYSVIINSLKINVSMSLIGIKDMVRENSFKKNYNIL